MAITPEWKYILKPGFLILSKNFGVDYARILKN